MKEHLPVRQLRIGDTGSPLDGKKARYTLGPLICEGDSKSCLCFDVLFPECSFCCSTVGDVYFHCYQHIFDLINIPQRCCIFYFIFIPFIFNFFFFILFFPFFVLLLFFLFPLHFLHFLLFLLICCISSFHFFTFLLNSLCLPWSPLSSFPIPSLFLLSFPLTSNFTLPFFFIFPFLFLFIV